ncbi:MAG: hypothetical protein ACNS61_11940 [Candidatus Wenzhouxiangella sp. M2_3B_020]
MDCKELDARAREVLDFDDEDLEANRRGELSRAQADRLQGEEDDRERLLTRVAVGASIAGLGLLFVDAMLGLTVLAIGAAALGIRGVNRARRGGIVPGASVETITGPIELHRTLDRNNDGYEYRLWAGMQYGETASGLPISGAEQVLHVEKELFEALTGGADYAIHHFRGTAVAVECRSVSPRDQVGSEER